MKDLEKDLLKEEILKVTREQSLKITAFLKSEKENILNEGYAFAKLGNVTKDQYPKAVYRAYMAAWHWSDKLSIESRVEEIFDRHSDFFIHLRDRATKGEKIKILDLGCGFCSYWPILVELGASEIVGIDLYSERDHIVSSATSIALCNDMINLSYSFKQSLQEDPHSNDIILRGDHNSMNKFYQSMLHTSAVLFELFCRNNQSYSRTAKRLILEFISDPSSCRIFKGDVREITMFLSREDDNTFDSILCLYPGSKKVQSGTTGIPEDLFNAVKQRYLKEGGVVAFDKR